MAVNSVHWTELDFGNMRRTLKAEGYERMCEEHREECLRRVREAFAEGRLIAGTNWHHAHLDAHYGCVMGILGYHGPVGVEPIMPSHELFRGSGRVLMLLMTMNNFACVGDGYLPGGVMHNGIPTRGAGANFGLKLARIKPLERLFQEVL